MEVISGEKRPITVLFVDLVGSTALSSQLDPEDYLEVLSLYRSEISKAILKYAGVVGKFLGDGCLGYFGFPVTHEDDGRRAVLAGLSILGSLTDLNSKIQARFKVSLSIRLGAHSGIVVVDQKRDLLESTDVLGVVPNMASRIQELSQPGQILVSSATYNLVYPYFVSRSLGLMKVKGFDSKIQVFQIIAENSPQMRAMIDDVLAPAQIANRFKEFELIDLCWQNSLQGNVQVVGLSGEPGIGKSKLVSAIQEKLKAANEKIFCLNIYASSFHKNSPLFALREALSWTFNLLEQDGAEKKISKLRHSLGHLEIDEEKVDTVIKAMDLPLSQTSSVFKLSAMTLRDRTFDALTTTLNALANDNPLVLTVEDIDLLDDSSRDFILKFIERSHDKKVLTLLTSRSRESLKNFPIQHFCEIGPLQPDACEQMIANLSSTKELAAEIKSKILEQSEGLPLYIHEMIQSLSGGTDVLTSPNQNSEPENLSIPLSIADVMISRYDTLSPKTKKFIRLAVIAGRTFDAQQIQLAFGVDSSDLTASIQEAVDSKIIEPVGFNFSHFKFHHQLFRDSIYSLILKRERQDLHRRFGDGIAKNFPDFAATEPGYLANHFHEGKDFRNATQYWLLAAERSLAQCALTEAQNNFNLGLQAISESDNPEALVEEELRLYSGLMSLYFATEGWCSESANTLGSRAQKVLQNFPYPGIEFQIVFKLRAYALFRGQMSEQIDLALRQLTLAESLHDSRYTLAANLSCTTAFSFLGEIKKSLSYAQNVTTHYKDQDSLWYRIKIGSDPFVLANVHVVSGYWQLGRFEQARKLSEKVFSYAKESLKTPYEIAVAKVWNYSWFLYLARDFEELSSVAERGRLFSSQQGYKLLSAFASCLEGFAKTELGDPKEGSAIFEQGHSMWKKMKIELGTGFLGSLGALIQLKLGRSSEAEMTLLASAHDITPGRETSYALPYYFNASLFYLKTSQTEKAQLTIQRGLEFCQKNGSIAWKIRFQNLNLQVLTDPVEIGKISQEILEDFETTPEMLSSPEYCDIQITLKTANQRIA